MLLLSIFLGEAIAQNTNAGFKDRKQSVTPRDSTVAKVDNTLALKSDSLATDSSAVDSINLRFADGDVKDIIHYKASDSIVYDVQNKMMYLYNDADLAYQQITLQSKRVDFDWNTFTLTAKGEDSSGVPVGEPVFTDGGKMYNASKMMYNFKTKKGKVFEVVTQEGDAFIHSEQVKRNEYEEWYGYKNIYSTCDLDHPHFYFRAKKVKMVPNKVLVTGPTSLFVADVPLPIGLPFGLFPAKQGRKSGIIIPQYQTNFAAVSGGNSDFFLRDGGYYWAVNDYLGLKFLGTASTGGTFGASLGADYNWRYHFRGNFDFAWVRQPPANPDLPNAKGSDQFKIGWTLVQDPRFLPNAQLSANVQIQTGSYNEANYIRDERIFQTTLYSTVGFGYSIPRTPLSFSIQLGHNQNLQLHTINFTLPSFRIGMSRIAPFKPKVASEKPKWYENIGITYSLEAKNFLSTIDSTLFESSTKDKFQFGVLQTAGIDAPIRLFKYFNFTPSVSYNERSYIQYIEKHWRPDTLVIELNDTTLDTLYRTVQIDTFRNFKSARNLSASASFNTKLTGIFNFKGKWIKALRHEFTPTIGFSYQPDMAGKFWNNYRTYQVDTSGRRQYYSFYEGQLYNAPAPGTVAALTFGISNNFEMKVFSKSDTVKNEKKIPILRSFNISSNYNFAADSLRLGDFSISGNTELYKNLGMRFNVLLSPYTTDSTNRKIEKWQYDVNRKLLRFSQGTIGATATFGSKTQTSRQVQPDQLQKPTNPGITNKAADYVSFDPDEPYHHDIPWNVSADYNFTISRGTYNNPDTLIVSQSIRAGFDIGITKHWSLNLTTGYDITRKALTYTNLTVSRDLHCWQLQFSLIAQGTRLQQFNIMLSPRSGTLKDLKVQRNGYFPQEF